MGKRKKWTLIFKKREMGLNRLTVCSYLVFKMILNNVLFLKKIQRKILVIKIILRFSEYFFKLLEISLFLNLTKLLFYLYFKLTKYQAYSGLSNGKSWDRSERIFSSFKLSFVLFSWLILILFALITIMLKITLLNKEVTYVSTKKKV